MFIPFNIKKSTIETVCGDKQYSFDTSYISQNLRENINVERVKQALIEGTRLQEEWFPSESLESRFQVFISHSHSDETTVKKLAGHLKEQYELSSFIDSLYWGYVNDLQKSLDDFYASIIREGRKYYNYNTRNFLTANVHIMLSMALMKMMDACECLIFVDSDNSLKYEKGAKVTPSPWIYEEMEFSKRLWINIPQRFKKKEVTLNESREQSSYRIEMSSTMESRQAQFHYEVDMGHVKELLCTDFPNQSSMKGETLLDHWYKKYVKMNLLRRING